MSQPFKTRRGKPVSQQKAGRRKDRNKETDLLGGKGPVVKKKQAKKGEPLHGSRFFSAEKQKWREKKDRADDSLIKHIGIEPGRDKHQHGRQKRVPPGLLAKRRAVRRQPLEIKMRPVRVPIERAVKLETSGLKRE